MIVPGKKKKRKNKEKTDQFFLLQESAAEYISQMRTLLSGV